MDRELPPSALSELMLGNKVEAIKIVRAQNNLQLKEAKDIVDAYVESHPDVKMELQKVSSNSLQVVLAIIGALVLLIYWFSQS